MVLTIRSRHTHSLVQNKVEDIKTSTGYGYIASYAGTALSGVIEQNTFSLRSSLGLDLAVASSSSYSWLQAVWQAVILRLRLPRCRGGSALNQS